MNKYHVRLSEKFKGPSKVSIAIMVGDRRSMIAFNKNQEDSTASDFPRKTVWLKPEVALELKVKGFDVRKAATPKKTVKQRKPKKEKNS